MRALRRTLQVAVATTSSGCFAQHEGAAPTNDPRSRRPRWVATRLVVSRLPIRNLAGALPRYRRSVCSANALRSRSLTLGRVPDGSPSERPAGNTSTTTNSPVPCPVVTPLPDCPMRIKPSRTVASPTTCWVARLTLRCSLSAARLRALRHARRRRSPPRILGRSSPAHPCVLVVPRMRARATARP